MKWLIYGANGFTGSQMVREALAAGHHPIVAGRNAGALHQLAKAHGLEARVFGLDDLGGTLAALQAVDVLVNAAGPFIHTHQPLVSACLAQGVHYLDITGEVPVFERLYKLHEMAVRQGVAIIPGMGFDVVPTDCLAHHVVGLVPEPTLLQVGIWAREGAISSGTMRTMLEHMSEGTWVRRGGELATTGFASEHVMVPLAGAPRKLLLAPLADVSASWHHLRIPNIRGYIGLPERLADAARVGAPAASMLLRFSPLKQLVQNNLQRFVKGPTPQQQLHGRTYCWARVRNEAGEAAQATLESVEAYRFTAISVVKGVERLLARPLAGAFSPSQAFGPDFALEMPDTARFSS